MLKSTTLDFLKRLKKNNNKEWFDENRKAYSDAKSNIEGFAEALIDVLGNENALLKDLKPKDCLFRINRDIRFSKDKSPYKTNLGIALCEGGRKSGKAGYYLHIEPGKSFIAGGCWQPMPEALKNIRQEIDYHGNEFLKIVQNKDFQKLYGDLSAEDSLARAPQGYDEANPLIGYIKLKSYVAVTKLTDDELLGKQSLKTIEKKMRVLDLLIRFLNRAIG